MTSTPKPYVTSLLILCVAVVLTGCPDRPGDRPEVEAEAPTNGVDPDALIGTWLLVEQGGRAPETLWSVTFTTTGDYVVMSETRAIDRKHYNLTGENMIALADSIGAETTEYFTYRLSGDRLYLNVPGEEVTTVLERRPDLVEHRPDLVPPIPPDPHPDDLEALDRVMREFEEPVDGED